MSGGSQYLHVELSEVVVQNPTGQTAETQVGTEASGTGIQRARVDPGVLQVGHPHLNRWTQLHSSDHLRYGHVKQTKKQTHLTLGSSHLKKGALGSFEEEIKTQNCSISNINTNSANTYFFP